MSKSILQAFIFSVGVHVLIIAVFIGYMEYKAYDYGFSFGADVTGLLLATVSFFMMLILFVKWVINKAR
ncbi:hypothetical protein LOK74_15540 [Brevibacillus humidisoli]|uniref:hypothetical protein n=1 Tax=Brevibacillus humidisoli TaxID=2895522 RepID=UPI001E43D776|nr:hypothetical protein [Brevibacillus humidisoli]UFJ39465.1 hypothetical protein LOK74_15540 [Brevibacillus humidisoli]